MVQVSAGRVDQSWAWPFCLTHLSLSWYVTLDVGDVTVTAVYLHPLLNRPGHDLLRESLCVLQEHRVDLRTVVRCSHLRMNQVGPLAPRPLTFAVHLLCGVCILVAPLGFDAPHTLEDVALIGCEQWETGYGNNIRESLFFLATPTSTRSS